jgi:long-chain acyl-CoA synthetase
MLAVLPFFHSYGLSATVMGGAAMGATLILHHRFNTRQVIRLIEQERPSVFHAVPAMLTAMNERFKSHPADLKSLRWVISGGAPLEPEVAREFAGHSNALVVEGYGLSEASPVTHVGPLYQPPRYGTIGMPLPETEVRILDPRCDAAATDDTRWVASNDPLDTDDEVQACEVSSGAVGELVVRGPQVMLGYWRDAQSTAEAIQDGWLHTGDLATVDSDGFYRIVGRKKDLIITSGFNVYPAEVEEVLCNVPGVAGAAVVGVLDHACGEVVKAVVQMQPGAVWDEAALRAACNLNLAKHKRPRIFRRFEGELPRNFLGKLIRRHLRDSYALPSGRDGSTRNSVTGESRE